MDKELEPGDIARINKTSGPFSSGTLVRVLEIVEDDCRVKIVAYIDDAYAANLKSHGIERDGEFTIKADHLTRRRYQLT